ncbi:MAG TPA: histidine--tRNA ligase [bacterium]
MTLQALRGTSDILEDDARRWAALERAVRRTAALYGYREIRTPVIEDAALFLRSIGETTDIIQKEMFRFQDRGGHEIVLRPEGTAPVIRACLEHHLQNAQSLVRLFYLGPMFRAERPQAGRFRQFHQFGAEAIGSDSPWIDVEMIRLCMHLLEACGAKSLCVWVASMGTREDQRRSADALRSRLAPHRDGLCRDCRSRMDNNVFRVLDCREPGCRKLAWAGAATPFLLCQESAEHFDAVRRGLELAGVPFDDSKTFARGLDYYTRTVFEVRASGLGAQDAVAAGGRYDHLTEELGGPRLGAVGFAAGIERVLLAAGEPAEEPAPRRGVYLAVARPAQLEAAARLAHELRRQGIGVIMDYENRSLKSQLRDADKRRCRVVAIVGDEELRKGVITVRDLEDARQEEINVHTLAEALASRLPKGCAHG